MKIHPQTVTFFLRHLICKLLAVMKICTLIFIAVSFHIYLFFLLLYFGET